MSDQDKGPIFGVPLPDFIQIPGGEKVEVPRNRECYIEGLGESLWAAFEAALALVAAIDRGGYDVSPCLICQELTVHIPGGLAICRQCAEKAGD